MKRIPIVALLLILIAAQACSGKPPATAQPTATIPPSPIPHTPTPLPPTATFTPTPPPQGPCANIFLPLLPGAEWLYQGDTSNGARMRLTVTGVEEGLASFVATGGGGTSGLVNVYYIGWYAPYIGLVRLQVTSMAIGYTQDTAIPIPVDNLIELQEYTHGG